MVGDNAVRDDWLSLVRGWQAYHFSVSERTSGLPELLRKVASALEELGQVEVHDMTLMVETTESDPEFTITVYFSFPEE